MTNRQNQECKEYDLSSILEECRKSAKIGFDIASGQEKNLNHALSVAKEKVRETLFDFNSSPCYSPEVTGLLEGQLTEIEQAFMKLSFVFKDDLENLRGKLNKFSITLFGRTMAGKSTLMEILTRGDGASIGKGAQRTTRDIRTYTWNKLEITDVPGVGAFEGEDDEQIAFEAAKTADLILFLLTDDAPQAAEADCFSRIINLGKPVICVLNVKAAISEEKSLKLVRRDIEKKFDTSRLNSIREQFLKYSDQFGQKWSHIPFVYTHLKAAYYASQSDNQEEADIYYEMSRFDNLKKQIVNQVTTRGKFLRVKTFIDIVSNPILESMENLLSQSQVNSAQGRTILAKKRQIEDWKERFYRDSIIQIASLMTKIKSELNSEIAGFAEDHFSDKNADKVWNQLLKERSIELKCQELLEDFETKANDKLKEVSREITNELNYAVTVTSEKVIKTKRIINGKKVWNWSSVIVSSGFSIAAGIAYLVGAAVAGPLGWIALGVTGFGALGSFFFKSRDKKEFAARTQLESSLRDSVVKICSSLQRQMENSLDTLVSARIVGLIKEMDKINSVIFRLADTQRELAWGLNDHLIDLNVKIVDEALKMIDAEDLRCRIKSVARIPGNTSLVMLKDGMGFPGEQRDALYKLMSERIYFVYETDNTRNLISRMLGRGVERDIIKIEEIIGIAHVPLDDATPDMLIRIRLAQQFTRMQIIN